MIRVSLFVLDDICTCVYSVLRMLTMCRHVLHIRCIVKVRWCISTHVVDMLTYVGCPVTCSWSDLPLACHSIFYNECESHPCFGSQHRSRSNKINAYTHSLCTSRLRYAEVVGRVLTSGLWFKTTQHFLCRYVFPDHVFRNEFSFLFFKRCTQY